MLSYRTGTARRPMSVNSCYVSRGMGAGKVSDSKSDLQGHPRALAMVRFDRSHTISYKTSIATMFILHCFRDIITYFPKVKEVM